MEKLFSFSIISSQPLNEVLAMYQLLHEDYSCVYVFVCVACMHAACVYAHVFTCMCILCQ